MKGRIGDDPVDLAEDETGFLPRCAARQRIHDDDAAAVAKAVGTGIALGEGGEGGSISTGSGTLRHPRRDTEGGGADTGSEVEDAVSRHGGHGSREQHGVMPGAMPGTRLVDLYTSAEKPYRP